MQSDLNMTTTKGGGFNDYNKITKVTCYNLCLLFCVSALINFNTAS